MYGTLKIGPSSILICGIVQPIGNEMNCLFLSVKRFRAEQNGKLFSPKLSKKNGLKIKIIFVSYFLF